jgi:hypothetical protein
MFLLWVDPMQLPCTSTSTNVKFTGPHVSVAIACAKLGVELQVITEAAGNCAMVGAVVSANIVIVAV